MNERVNAPARARVLLAEDHPASADLLRGLLQTTFDVVASVADGPTSGQTPGTSTWTVAYATGGNAPPTQATHTGVPAGTARPAAGSAAVTGPGQQGQPNPNVARAFFDLGSRVISIQGAGSESLLFWTDRLGSVSHQHIITTDDGTAGRKGLVTEPLKELLQEDAEHRIACVYAIGPAVMMRACAACTEPFGVKTVVSLNTVMVDGTGMCGGCRVDLRGQTRFTCTDGPEFDGHLVDWQQLLSRQKIYAHQEACSLDRYVKEWKERHE